MFRLHYVSLNMTTEYPVTPSVVEGSPSTPVTPSVVEGSPIIINNPKQEEVWQPKN